MYSSIKQSKIQSKVCHLSLEEFMACDEKVQCSSMPWSLANVSKLGTFFVIRGDFINSSKEVTMR